MVATASNTDTVNIGVRSVSDSSMIDAEALTVSSSSLAEMEWHR